MADKPWRPSKWERIKGTAVTDTDLNDDNFLDNVFEAGADAMWRAVQEGVSLIDGEWVHFHSPEILKALHPKLRKVGE